MNKKNLLLYPLLLLFGLEAYGQLSNIRSKAEGQAIMTTPGQVPFWMWANQHGSVPLPGPSFSLLGEFHKDYDSTRVRFADWAAGFNGRANMGERAEFILIEGYGKIRMGVFELKGGRTKDVAGLTDTTLSSGAFAISGNALGIPKVQVSIPEFYSLPVWGKLFAFKGNYSHGWLGQVPIQLEASQVRETEILFHQKSLYGRFGKPAWKWKLYGGFNHEVFWGNTKAIFGDKFTLTPFQEYTYVVMGKAYGSKGIGKSKLGNHIGSIDLGMEIDFGSVGLLAYRQNIYDVGALYYLANVLDGLNGISLRNKRESRGAVGWKRLLFEVLYTKNQAGQEWSNYTPSGDENYYNNPMFGEGWSFKGLALGNPLLSTRTAVRPGHPNEPRDFFINNRVTAFHFGALWNLKNWHFFSQATYSLNYGTYGTHPLGHSLGKKRSPARYGLFGEVKQFSAYLEGERKLRNGLRYGFVAALDQGGLYENSFGMLIKFSKSFGKYE